MIRNVSRSLDQLDPSEEWAAWKPAKADPFDARWAGHLYRRAGFGHTPVELTAAVADGLDKTLERMHAPARTTPKLPAVPETMGPTFRNFELRAEWLKRMLAGHEPIRERLTLFWHNHFATSIARIQDATLMQRQNDLIRKHALGKFGPFLRDMSRDAAMLLWLDSNQNVKAHPNENYAREVMELFSLGVGNYKEKDIQEAARAFTGWHVSTPGDGERRFEFKKQEHDFGRKTVLGQTGEWDGDDIIRILLEQPACARFLVRKLYAFLFNEGATPPDKLIEPLAIELRASDYDIGKLVDRMLRSRHFFSEHAYRKNIKSPIEFCVGASRVFGTGATGSVVMSPFALIGALELQGQQPYQPPNVKGWEGGKAWLNTATVLARHNFTYDLCNGGKSLNEEVARVTGQGFVPFVDPLLLYRRARLETAGEVVAFYGNLLLPGDLNPEIARKLTAYIEKDDPPNALFEQRCRDAMHAMITLPEYQLN